MAITVNGTNGFTTDNGALKLDTDTLVIDDTNNRVGIGTSSPAEQLEVYGTEASGGVELLLTNYGDGGGTTTPYAAIRARLNPIRNGGEIRFGRDSTYSSAAAADSNIQFYTASDDVNIERMRINSSGIVTKPNQPSFAGNLGASNVTTGTTTTLLPVTTTANHNIGNHFDDSAGNYKFTCPVAGRYLFSLSTLIAPSSGTSSYVRTWLYKNGSAWFDGLGDQGTYGSYQRLSWSIIVDAAANDYFQYYGMGNTSTTFFYTSYTRACGYLLG